MAVALLASPATAGGQAPRGAGAAARRQGPVGRRVGRPVQGPRRKPVRVPGGSLDLNGLKGSNFVAAVDEAMGDGCRVTVTADALVLHVDRKKLPKDCDAALRAVRVFTAVEYPDATAAQRKAFGLHLPPAVDPAKPLVVLIHGVDSDRQGWEAMATLVEGTGRQVRLLRLPRRRPHRRERRPARQAPDRPAQDLPDPEGGPRLPQHGRLGRPLLRRRPGLRRRRRPPVPVRHAQPGLRLGPLAARPGGAGALSPLAARPELEPDVDDHRRPGRGRRRPEAQVQVPQAAERPAPPGRRPLHDRRRGPTCRPQHVARTGGTARPGCSCRTRRTGGSAPSADRRRGGCTARPRPSGPRCATATGR